MKRTDKRVVVRVVFPAASLAVAIFALIIASGCSAQSNSKTTAEKAATEQGSRAGGKAAPANGNPGIDLQCAMTAIQNPTESFHYSYKKDSSNPVHQEADVTPQSIDGFRVDVDGQQLPLHGVRSDPQSWQGALSGLMGISGMSSAVAIVNHGSAMRREGDGGQVNGYNTIHYSIDTARFDDAEQRILGSTMGPGGFEKGEAWVTSAGCPVKLILDDEMHKNDGSLLEKIHYEVAMVKK